ncbi:MAG: branched-chain amino acid transport system II carrier protein [Verrucomicrobia bacterium]|nr:branched-chain amino acid transport system II carrier protein [Verrucomicrobiota bacterium]
MKSHWAIISAGLALFSMFFGAGNLVFPLLLGQAAGSHNFYALLGLVMTGVLFPLIGLLAIMLFAGNNKVFFGKIGALGALLYLIIQFVMGPIGSIPRLINVSYGTLAPYFPSLSLIVFSLIAAFIAFLLVLRPSRLLSLLGSLFTPILLLSLGSIIVLGLIHPPSMAAAEGTGLGTFLKGSLVGYGTLDLLAAFLFGRFVLHQFQREGEAPKQLMGRFFKASLIASALLGLTYGGLTYVAAFHLNALPAGIPPEGLLSALAIHLLGAKGALIANIAVVMACLTTALTQIAIFSEYLQQDLLRRKIPAIAALLITLLMSAGFANLGFSGIMAVLKPIINVAYPICIALSIWNIGGVLINKKQPAYAQLD